MVPKEPDAPFGLTSDPGSREENQDSAAIDYALESSSEYICRVVVADGVSGEAGGRIASSLAVKTVLTATSDADDFREALQQSIATANRAILDYSASKFRGQRLATTVVAAILTEDAVSVGHVGDSRAYLFHGGQLIRLTRDHTVTQQLLDERRITEAQALSHPDRHKLTKALGHRPTVEPDLVTYYVAKGDIMLLCTDGLTEGLSDAEITDSVTGRTDMAGVSKTLVAAAKRAGVQDNITVAIVRVI
jgi:protein phosphatase